MYMITFNWTTMFWIIISKESLQSWNPLWKANHKISKCWISQYTIILQLYSLLWLKIYVYIPIQFIVNLLRKLQIILSLFFNKSKYKVHLKVVGIALRFIYLLIFFNILRNQWIKNLIMNNYLRIFLNFWYWCKVDH